MAKQVKIIFCKNCNTQIPTKVKKCPACGAKNKKPFYKKWWLVLLILILAISILKPNGDKAEEIVWTEMVLGEYLPAPSLEKGKVSSNSERILSVDLHKAKEEDFKSYVAALKAMAYTEDAFESDTSYIAYNTDGDQVSVHFWQSDDQLDISLYPAEEMGSITFPQTGVGSQMPLPATNMGKVVKDSSDVYQVWIGQTTKDIYAAYVAACEEAGFIIGYDKKEESYTAYNEEGIKIKVIFRNYQTMEITIEAAKEEVPEESTPQPELPSESVKESESKMEEVPSQEPELVDGLRPEFKEAMDSYEAFYKEYCEVLKAYTKNPTDLPLLGKYTKLMQEAVEMGEAFDKWGGEELNTAETLYYVEVSGRVAAMLLEVGGQ